MDTSVFKTQYSQGNIDIEGVKVDDIPKNSQGSAQSEGYVVITGGEKVYLPDISPDIASVVDQLQSIVDKVNSMVNDLQSPQGPCTSVSWTANKPILDQEIAAIKEALK